MLMKVLSANAATSTTAEKISGQTVDKQTNKQSRKPLSKGDSRTGLIAFHISNKLEGYSRHNRQLSLNKSHLRISHC